MTRWIAVSPTHHAGKHYTPRQDYSHTQGQMVAPVVLSEMAAVLPHYLLGFLPVSDGIMPVAVLGIEQGHNLYLHQDGRWLAKYSPAVTRAFPFALATSDNTAPVLAIAADQVSETGVPLFEGESLSQSAADVLAFLTHHEQARQATLKATRALSDAGILIEWPLDVPVGEEHKQVKGLLRVNERALNQLATDTYASLRGAPMQLAYAQLYSIAQRDQLTMRAALHQQMSTSEPAGIDLSAVFGEDNDTLSFNF